MEPTLRHGDLLLARWGATVRPGDIAVVRLPDDARGTARPVSVKRILGRDPDDPLRWWLDSDNPREGLTSFDIGSIPDEDALAVVLARIAPRPGRMRQRHTP